MDISRQAEEARGLAEEEGGERKRLLGGEAEEAGAEGKGAEEGKIHPAGYNFDDDDYWDKNVHGDIQIQVLDRQGRHRQRYYYRFIQDKFNPGFLIPSPGAPQFRELSQGSTNSNQVLLYQHHSVPPTGINSATN